MGDSAPIGIIAPDNRSLPQSFCCKKAKRSEMPDQTQRCVRELHRSILPGFRTCFLL